MGLTTVSSAATMLAVAGAALGPPAPPSFVVIYADDQGWTGTSVLSDPSIPESASDFYLTPRLEALAAEGMRFTDAYASAPVCSASRAALLTGKSPGRLQLTDVVCEIGGSRFQSLYVGKPLSPPVMPSSMASQEITIAEHLKQAMPQYRTALIGKWHLTIAGQVTALDQGFDVWHAGDAGAPPSEDPKDVFGVTEASAQFIQDSVGLGQPFLLIVSHYAVHAPWEARPELVAQYESLPPGDRHDDPTYAAMTEDLDTAAGMILDQITALGIEDSTYVIYTSDNGAVAALGDDENDPLYNAKGSVYEGGIRVPMIIRGPGIAPDSVCATPVVGHDLFTTIMSLAGAAAALPEGVEGADLSPLLFNGGNLPVEMDSLSRPLAPGGELYFHYPHYVNGGEGPRIPASAVRDGDFKLVRIYGALGEPDTLLLFDLSACPQESADPGSPLNLAGALPEKAAELDGKLEQWIQAADLSLAYPVAENVLLEWEADLPGDVPGGWRSTIDVDHLLRETWTLDPEPGTPALIDIAPHALSRAFSFDGDDGMTRKFFHVSDPKYPDTYDADHSASFELWLRVEALDHEQVLLESGDGAAGLSMTLGDADGDGRHNDLRFRILGSDGNQLTVTAPIDGTADPTLEFVQIVGVLSDNPGDRYAEIYVNGVLAEQVQGEPGPDELDWDGYDPAGLGRAGGGLGGNGGAGDLPFYGGGFAGQVALVRFNNYALGGVAILARYLDVTCPMDLDGDGEIGIQEFLAVLGGWGTPGGDVTGDGDTDIDDFLAVLGNWGPCSAQSLQAPSCGACREKRGGRS